MFLVSVQDRCSVCVKSMFQTHPIVLLGDEGLVELCSVHLNIFLLMTQDRCTVCTEHTIGIEIILDALGGTPR
jgi:hypothetical protein